MPRAAQPRCILASKCFHRVLTGRSKNGHLQYSGRRLTPANQAKFGGGTCVTCHRGPICCEFCFEHHSCLGETNAPPALVEERNSDVADGTMQLDEEESDHYTEEEELRGGTNSANQFPLQGDAFVSGCMFLKNGMVASHAWAPCQWASSSINHVVSPTPLSLHPLRSMSMMHYSRIG